MTTLTYNAALTTQILSASDGPHAREADLFVKARICEGCYLSLAFDDGLCAGCIRRLEEQNQAR